MKTKDEWRYHYAGLAMQALSASFDYKSVPPEVIGTDVIATWAIQHADALLAELERTAICDHIFQIYKADLSKPCSFIKGFEGALTVAENIIVKCAKCGAVKAETIDAK